MPASLVVGTQWGDEGKGKIVDILAEKAHMVVRYQGGNNAGHTVVNDQEKYEMHLLPSGVLYPDTMAVMGQGMVIDPWALIEEMEGLNKKGVSIENLYISDSAHLVLPYHILLDKLEEKLRGTDKLGTTVKGIGPAYTDKAARRGIRMGDILHPQRLKRSLEIALRYHNQVLKKVFHESCVDLEELLAKLLDLGEILKPHICNTSLKIAENWEAGRHIFFEGAHGTLLDIDNGSYPYVTSSSTVAGAVAGGAGFPPGNVDEIIGVVKAYTTRVGEGVFPTEEDSSTGDKLREAGGEYGVTTRRPRRCGWLDIPLLKHSLRINGADWLALTKMDVLSFMDEIQVATAYKLDGEIIQEMPTDMEKLERCEPVYEFLPGWKQDLQHIREYENLPSQAREYVKFLEEKTHLPVKLISVGPDRKQVILRGGIG